jgi:hypothetical protein
MKRNLFILIVIAYLFMFRGALQAQGYRSLFSDSTTSWLINSNGYCHTTCTRTFSVVKDTIINALTYKLMFPRIALREDTIQGKTWAFNFQKSKEYLVMDLNLNLNDTFKLYSYNDFATNYKVDSIYFLNGIKHLRLNKVIKPCHTITGEKMFFKEGVGPSAGFDYQVNWLASYMLCQYKKGQKTSGNTIFNNICYLCDVMSTGEIDGNTNKLQVFPNPANDQLNVRTFLEGTIDAGASVYNSFGQQVFTVTINSPVSRFEISDLNPGVYYLEVKGKGSVARKRFIINH